MSKGKPCLPAMSLREKQHMNLDTELSTHIGMDGQSRSSHKYLLLQVWCGLLTVAMVVMATVLTSIKPKPPEGSVSTDNPTVSPLVNASMTPIKSAGPGPSHSYIELIKSVVNDSWEETHTCHPCSLMLKNNSIHSTKDSIYFIYAQVTFTKHPKTKENKYVILKREATYGRKMRKLAEGTFPSTTVGSVWVAKIIKLQANDSVSLTITDDYLKDSTFWGAFQLQ